MPDQPTNNNNSTNSNDGFNIEVIPSDYYGGAKRAPSVVSLAAPGVAATRPAPSANGPAASASPAPVRVSGGGPSPKLIIGLVAGLMVLVVGGFAFYYIRQAQQIKQKQAAQQTPTAVETPPTTPPAAPETTAPAPANPPSAQTGGGGATTTPEVVPPAPPAVILPAKNYITALDTDNDGLTDEEEKLYKADSLKPDTDGDGYIDGLEVLNLYNPIGFKPNRLIDSDTVKVYLNPTYKYSLYYPLDWVAQAVDVNNQEVLFTSATGEFTQVTVEDNSLKMAVKDWYLAQAPGVAAADLKMVVTKEKVEGIMSPDGLAAYLPYSDKIYVIKYDIGIRTEVNFLQTFQMMINSFRTVGEVETPVSAPSATGTPATTTQP